MLLPGIYRIQAVGLYLNKQTNKQTKKQTNKQTKIQFCDYVSFESVSWKIEILPIIAF